MPLVLSIQRLSLAALGLACCLSSSPLLAQPGSATVLSIGDGDTLRVREGSHIRTVRLACIDAPETSQAPQGASARAALQALAPVGSALELRIQATDRYGRSVAELFRGGRNLNQALVASGAAFVYRQYIQGCDRNTYSRLETEARLRRLGVWSSPGGMTRPWDVRKARRSGRSQPSAPGMPRPVLPSSGGTHLTCQQIGSYARAQVLLRQGHSYLDGDGDGEACKSLRG
ncbi:MAG: thermonuclease family protein [Vulcanococcus sp.]